MKKGIVITDKTHTIEFCVHLDNPKYIFGTIDENKIWIVTGENEGYVIHEFCEEEEFFHFEGTSVWSPMQEETLQRTINPFEYYGDVFRDALQKVLCKDFPELRGEDPENITEDKSVLKRWRLCDQLQAKSFRGDTEEVVLNGITYDIEDVLIGEGDGTYSVILVNQDTRSIHSVYLAIVCPDFVNYSADFEKGEEKIKELQDDEANAKLIAAAPELLEFAENVNSICTAIKRGRSEGFDVDELREMAQELIKKATI